MQLTAYDVECAQRCQRKNVEISLTFKLAQLLSEDRRVLIENTHEVLENAKVKCRRDDFPTRQPFGSCRRQQTSAEPRLQEVIVGGFRYHFRGAQNALKHRMFSLN